MKNARVGVDAGIAAILRSVRTSVNALTARALLCATITSFLGHSAIVRVGLKIDAAIADFRQAGRAVTRSGFAKSSVARAFFRASTAIAWIVIEVRACIAVAARGQTRVGAATISAGARSERRIAFVPAHAAVCRI